MQINIGLQQSKQIWMLSTDCSLVRGFRNVHVAPRLTHKALQQIHFGRLDNQGFDRITTAKREKRLTLEHTM